LRPLDALIDVRLVAVDDNVAFTAFMTEVEPRLRRALVALRGREEGRDATAEALAWAWEHWAEVQVMANPAGYLYRVGQSRSRPRRALRHPAPAVHQDPAFEPGLGPALRRLSEPQRAAVVLVHGCGWTYQEVAAALNVSKSSVGTHVARALTRLRQELEVQHHG
jgi:DNA-directed RNA polymerase specialized sigma24 family protein